jgi:hypothetical protein
LEYEAGGCRGQLIVTLDGVNDPERKMLSAGRVLKVFAARGVQFVMK